MSDHDEVNRLVQRLIAALTMTQAELARQLGISPGTLYSWSVLRRRPSPENGRRLAELADRHARELAESASRLLRLLNGAPGRQPPRNP